MVQRNLLANRTNNTPNKYRVGERVAPSHCLWNGSSDSGDGGDHGERPTKRRRISSHDRDERATADEFPSWSTLLAPSSQFIIPKISCAFQNSSSSSSIDPRSNNSARRALSPPHFSGTYDLYSIDHQVPVSMQPSPELSIPNYEALYKTLSEFRSSSFTKPIAKCYLPDTEKTGSYAGNLVAPSIHDPLSEQHTHSINVSQVVPVGSLTFALDELPASESDVPSSVLLPVLEESPGILASLQVDGATGILPDIVDSFGEFKMRRVWTGTSDDGLELMELYQGLFSLNIFYGEEYEARGCIPLANHRQSFWGIRLHPGGSEAEST